MRKTLTALAAAATFAIAAVATPTSADARRWGWRGPAFFGGLAAGAFIAGALARPYYAPRPYYYYEPGPVYFYAPGPVQYEVYQAPGYDGCWGWRRGYRYYAC
jgi:hypothetical protein